MSQPHDINCVTCQHFEGVDFALPELGTVFAYTCLAFPKQIPEEVRSWKKPHNEIRKDQIGKFVYVDLRRK